MKKPQKSLNPFIIIAIIIGILFVVLNIFMIFAILDWQADKNEMLEQI